MLKNLFTVAALCAIATVAHPDSFETDNHAFLIKEGKYSQASVPESNIILGILAVSGSIFVGNRKQEKFVK
ncbi:hypothetical protein [Rivularia sp. UHCC 0363]|uniref:hypothetical protein n=1 Tax=Rivularia sp. UHCC 0363 TaxID=3110244 RepID=UPI002B201A08|nr:hypothetical protein [Rivularia sp. UHCC 0363]MEA5593816.1 hypothetical protein [Rivularia sp. UHCC 0363]